MEAWRLLLVLALLPVVMAVVSIPATTTVEQEALVGVQVEKLPPLVHILSAKRVTGHVYLSMAVQPPTPCHRISVDGYRAEDQGDYFKVELRLTLKEGSEPCIQVLPKPVEMDLDLNVPGGKPIVLKVEVEKESVQHEAEEVQVQGVKIENEAHVKYRVQRFENNVELILEGCYSYQVEPMRCPNCYTVFLRSSEGCNETRISLRVSGDFPAFIVLKGKDLSKKIEEEELGKSCEKIYEVLSEIDENTAAKVKEICENRSLGIERACEILRDLNEPAVNVVCSLTQKRALESTPCRCKEVIEKIREIAPDVAKELEILHRSSEVEEARKLACPILEKHYPRLYDLICKEKVPKIQETETNRNVLINRLRQEVERLREIVRRQRKQIRELVLKINELKRKLIITQGGIVDAETNEEINVPRVAVEVRVKNKNVLVEKNGGKIEINVGGKFKALVKAPVEVDLNTIKIGKKPVIVLPDEVIEKIKERFRKVEPVNVELGEEDNKPLYKVKARIRGRLLFFIPVEVPVEVHVDAETGEEVKVHRPWWSFLVWG